MGICVNMCCKNKRISVYMHCADMHLCICVCMHSCKPFQTIHAYNARKLRKVHAHKYCSTTQYVHLRKKKKLQYYTVRASSTQNPCRTHVQTMCGCVCTYGVFGCMHFEVLHFRVCIYSQMHIFTHRCVCV